MGIIGVVTFEGFMNSEGILNKFKVNLRNEGRGYNSFINRIKSTVVITSAFDWDKSAEGFAYWNDIDIKYTKYIN